MFQFLIETIHIIGSLAVLGILWVEIDDVYGITALRKLTKRKYRKFWRKFFHDSKKYHRKTKVKTHVQT